MSLSEEKPANRVVRPVLLEEKKGDADTSLLRAINESIDEISVSIRLQDVTKVVTQKNGGDDSPSKIAINLEESKQPMKKEGNN